MGKTKNINYFSVANMDLRQVGGNECHIINNDDITIILNGCPRNATFLREGEIYQLPEPRLLLIMSGKADIQLDLEHYHIEKGMLILTTPNTIMECTHCSLDLVVCGIAIKEHSHIPERVVMTCPAKDAEQLLRMMYLLWDIASQQPYRHDTVKQLTEAMISNAQYIKHTAETVDKADALPRSQQIFSQFKILVSKHCERERNIPFYASQLRVSPHHLSTVISKASGHSVMYWINSAVVLRARVLLKTSDLMTYEIADRLNFPNSPAFNSFFKRETGLTPKKYREIHFPVEK
ncbi:MAG: helix-turn-helix domain-containing protein [Prevotella sp.]|nr:helix-turn-helix domain-containing protein [Prevotella sp.]